MKLLRTQFKSHGFNYTQLERTDKAAIYKQVWGKDGSPAYEVIAIRVRQPDALFPEIREEYPSSEKWGKLGWTYTDYEKAREKFKTLTGK